MDVYQDLINFRAWLERPEGLLWKKQEETGEGTITVRLLLGSRKTTEQVMIFLRETQEGLQSREQELKEVQRREHRVQVWGLEEDRL